MKKTSCLFLFFAVFAITAYAQSPSEKEVTTTVEQLNKALIDADKNKLQELTAEELSYGHSSGKIENKTQFIEGAVNGAVDFVSIEISDQTITLAGDNAIVRHIFSAKISNGGTPADIKIGNLLVWKKQNGKWRLLARQAYKL